MRITPNAVAAGLALLSLTAIDPAGASGQPQANASDSARGSSTSTSARKLELSATSGDVALAGTLHVPSGTGPFPAVILTHGSEPGRRSNPGYLRVARAFRKRGIAALVFDKRGVGDSTGTYVEAPDLNVPAADVLAWVDRLLQVESIRGDRIGVLGWSQGGWVGPLAASKSDALRFVVSISGPGVSPLEQNIYDKTNQFRATGVSRELAERYARVLRLVWTYLATGMGRAEAQAAWDEVAELKWFRDAYQGPPMMDRDRVLKDERMVQYVTHTTYDPVPVLESLRVPMLAVFGGADTVVPVERSIAAMRDAFARGGNPNFRYEVIPGGDHGLRVIGADGRLALTPAFPDLVVDWVEPIVR